MHNVTQPGQLAVMQPQYSQFAAKLIKAIPVCLHHALISWNTAACRMIGKVDMKSKIFSCVMLQFARMPCGGVIDGCGTGQCSWLY